MIIKSFTVNPFQENTYVVSVDSGETMVIDPGFYSPSEENAFLRYLDDNGLTVKILVNTHLHIDHVLGNAFIEQRFGIKAFAHDGDGFWLNGLEAQGRMFGLPLRGEKPSIGLYLREGDKVSLGTEVFEVFEVPGHSPGSIVLYNRLQNCLFAGDVLFAGSVGRSDLAGGDHAVLIKGISDKLLTLPDDTVVYSGHGPSTTIGREKSSNPFL
ncbi:MAG: MBL fold metallo-hydrolase [Bacteroidales bacterium]|jgi:glyoxylase-like metal-dependent hydrolase (beta-lactamase superfamily II)|nr:MBL fold metallo-hydrolase [Bacteroidales bacterium]